MIIGDVEAAEREILEAFGERIGVQEDLFGGFKGAVLAAPDRVLATLDGAGVVEIIAVFGGYGEVGLFDAAEDFLVDPRLERGRGFHCGSGIGVLRFQVLNGGGD